MGAKEVRATRLGVLNIDNTIHEILPARSVEAIKSKWKSPAYRARVQELL